ncbi:MAG: hypothetical protein SF052_01310 [Bacteroidia bacterium]|nr:hypothetical protein [Bacteroidia bacterium]
MKQDEFKNMSIEELKGKSKTLKFLGGMLIGVLSVLLIVSIYLSVVNKEFNPSMIVAIALSAVLPSIFMSIKRIEKEMASRS